MHHGEIRFLITGSARLDYYHKGGDSLQGRYMYYRLHPFSVPELGGGKSACLDLLRFGGVPEPLLKGDGRFWRRWQRNRRQRIVEQDIRDLEWIREITLVELLMTSWYQVHLGSKDVLKNGIRQLPFGLYVMSWIWSRPLFLKRYRVCLSEQG